MNYYALARVAIPTQMYSKSRVPANGTFVRLDTKMCQHFYLVAMCLGLYSFFFFIQGNPLAYILTNGIYIVNRSAIR